MLLLARFSFNGMINSLVVDHSVMLKISWTSEGIIVYHELRYVLQISRSIIADSFLLCRLCFFPFPVEFSHVLKLLFLFVLHLN